MLAFTSYDNRQKIKLFLPLERPFYPQNEASKPKKQPIF
jgi:hypothetical protein